jgi:hypothetical protein
MCESESKATYYILLQNARMEFLEFQWNSIHQFYQNLDSSSTIIGNYDAAELYASEFRLLCGVCCVP